MTAGSVLSQLTNLFFLASGLFNDLLIIRLCLTLAYLFLLASAIVGLPGWNESMWTGRMAVDIIVWSIANIVVVHGSGVIRMYYDERPISFPQEFDMLWRFFYRHSGLSRAQFQALMIPHLELKTFREGDLIPCKDHFYILLDGMVLMNIVHKEVPSKTHTIRLASGDMFPLLYIYKNYVPRKAIFHRSAIGDPRVESTTVRAFCISLNQLERMAVNPHARDAWTSLLIASLAEIAERQYLPNQNNNNNNGSGENIIDGSRTAKRLSSGQIPSTTQQQHNQQQQQQQQRQQEYFHPLFGPLAPSEEPDPLLAGAGGGLSRPLGHAWRYLKLSIYMPWPWGTWPVGLRHSLRPPIEKTADENNTV